MKRRERELEDRCDGYTSTTSGADKRTWSARHLYKSIEMARLRAVARPGSDERLW
jgi:hypothetical protein